VTKLPVVSGREAAKAFQREGWRLVRRRGSHMILAKPGVHFALSVPDHKELDRGTLRGLVRDAGLTVAQFVALLE
jgi:predicted RNA binding protein YcfA (HicA-like mRNA interferase family)